MLKWIVQPSPRMNAPQPRLCHLRKWAHFNGYGFNLHTEKNKEGQLVGKVDPGSPADAAGLKEGDKIIEVNGTNIGNENHGQVVARIKAGGEEARILVADKECADWHKEKGVVILASLPYVLHLSSEKAEESSSSEEEEEEHSFPQRIHVVEEQEEEEEEEEEEQDDVERKVSSPPSPATVPKASSTSSSSSETEEEDDDEVEQTRVVSPPPPVEPGRRSSVSSSDEEEVRPRSYSKQSRQSSKGNRNSSYSYNKDELVAGLHLNMTAAEMRARVNTHRKIDPRQDNIDVKKKAEIIKNL